MPIWGRGVYKRNWAWRLRRGFTLLELLITLVVLSVAAGLLVVKTRSSDAQQLHSEARQLAAILRIAQQEALLQGQPLRLVCTTQGYAFEQTQPNPTQAPGMAAPVRWQPVQHEALLRPRAWRVPGTQAVLEGDGQTQAFLLLGPGLGGVDQRVVLSLPPHRVVVQSLGALGFEVVSPNVRGATL